MRICSGVDEKAAGDVLWLCVHSCEEWNILRWYNTNTFLHLNSLCCFCNLRYVLSYGLRYVLRYVVRARPSEIRYVLTFFTTDMMRICSGVDEKAAGDVLWLCVHSCEEWNSLRCHNTGTFSKLIFLVLLLPFTLCRTLCLTYIYIRLILTTCRTWHRTDYRMLYCRKNFWKSQSFILFFSEL